MTFLSLTVFKITNWQAYITRLEIFARKNANLQNPHRKRENVLDCIMSQNWLTLEDRTILEDVIVMTAEQAETLMPLTVYEYDAINKLDMWQEMWG